MSHRTFAEMTQHYPGCQWSFPADVFLSDLGVPAPSFRLLPGACVFTVGSCFARTIEEALHDRGFVIPMLDFGVPKEEYPFRPNGILNRYTVSTIDQTFAWAESIQCGLPFAQATEPFLLPADSGIIDIDLAAFAPVSEGRAWARRKEMLAVWRRAFEADVVVLTLGQHETWLFEDRGLVWGNTPGRRECAPYWSRTRFLQLPFNELLATVVRTMERIRRYNPRADFLITVSPVPAERYFNGQDALTSYWSSKSLLRSVAAAVCEKVERTDYFPAFELVHAGGRSSWKEDGMHVRHEVVHRIIARLLEAYAEAPTEPAQTPSPSDEDAVPPSEPARM